jgi:hypothetical protein
MEEHHHSRPCRHRQIAQSSGLTIEPPPPESGPEPLYRALYTIDVNAPNARRAAECAYQIMKDPTSIRPILHVLDHDGAETTVDLALGCPDAAPDTHSDESYEKARRFVAAAGTQCPACDSQDINFGTVELDAQHAYQEACCIGCQVRFCAVYRLVGYGLHTGGSFEVHTIGEDFGGLESDQG